MARAHLASFSFVAALATLAASCTLVSDFGQPQCSRDAHCTVPGLPMACVEGLCEFATCTHTADCQTRGGEFADSVCIDGSCVTPQCFADADCEGTEICYQGACVDQEETRWGCIDNRPPGGIPDGTDVTYRTLVKILNGTMGIPAGPDLDVYACQTFTCDNARGPYKPDADGWVDVVVNRGFQGLLKMTTDTTMPVFLDLKSPVNEDVETDVVRLFPSGLAGALASLAGATADFDNKGLVLINVRDCIGGRAEGVQVTTTGTDMGETVFYVDANNIPATAAVATDPAGVAGIVNLTPGLPQVNLTRQSTGTPLRSFTVTVQAGFVTYVPIQLGL